MAQETNNAGSQSAPTTPKPVATAAVPATGPSPARPLATFAEALAELKRLEALPETTTEQQKQKAALLAPVKKAVFDLQQAAPVHPVNHAELAAQAVALAAPLTRMAVQNLAQQHPAVGKLLADLDAAQAEIASLKAALQAAK